MAVLGPFKGGPAMGVIAKEAVKIGGRLVYVYESRNYDDKLWARFGSDPKHKWNDGQRIATPPLGY